MSTSAPVLEEGTSRADHVVRDFDWDMRFGPHTSSGLDVRGPVPVVPTSSGFGVGDDGRIARHPQLAFPFDSPPPPLEFAYKNFCLVGDFSFGTHRDCWEEIEARGGRIHDDVTRHTDYLVIGDLAPQSPERSNFGANVETAVVFRQAIGRLAIVSETYWQRHLAVL